MAQHGSPERRPAIAASLASALDVDLGALTRGRAAAVFVDFDGTISAISPRPEEAALAPAMAAVLRELSRRCLLAVVSGRDLLDVRAKVGLPHVGYAGSHGFEFTLPNGKHWQHPAAGPFVPLLDALESDLAGDFARIPGAQIERKRFSLSAHYRRVAAGDLPAVDAAIAAAARGHPQLHCGRGKMLYDFRPGLDWHKGAGILEMRRQALPAKSAFTVFLGDDRTDEDAFRVLAPPDLAVVVGAPGYPTHARHSLRDLGEVQTFLTRLAAALP